jgi:hypothetical protein
LLAKLLTVLCHEYAFLVCLGHLGQNDTNRNDSVCINPRWPRQVRLTYSWHDTADSFTNELHLWKYGFKNKV